MVAALLAALLGLGQPASAQSLELFTLGSGDVGGGYYDAAAAVCDAVNRAERPQLRCSPEATQGSLYNLAGLRNRQLDVALVQSDLQRSAVEGTDEFEGVGPMAELRSVMSLYPETLTVLARGDAGIATMADLIGKRVDIGAPASGRHATVTRLLDALDLRPGDFAALLELPTAAALEELCAGRVDATILILGHPNAGIRSTLAGCGALLVPVAGPELEAVLTESSDYVQATIPASAYATLDRDVPTFAVIATVVTRADIPDRIVQALVKDTLENLPVLAIRAPVLEHLDPSAMREAGLSAPLHPGAEAAFAAPPASP